MQLIGFILIVRNIINWNSRIFNLRIHDRGFDMEQSPVPLIMLISLQVMVERSLRLTGN